MIKEEFNIVYDMICLSCENDMDNGFINEVEENMEDDITF